MENTEEKLTAGHKPLATRITLRPFWKTKLVVDIKIANVEKKLMKEKILFGTG